MRLFAIAIALSATNVAASESDADAVLAGLSYELEPKKQAYKRPSLRHVSRKGHGAHKKDIMAMPLEYTIGDETFEGYVAFPTHGKPGGLPALAIYHAWYGLEEGEKMRAEEAAKQGYVAFAVDMYGKGKRGSSPAEAMALIGELNALGADAVKMRAVVGLAQLRKPAGVVPMETRAPEINEDMLFASGYCAGGLWATELARAGINGLVGTSVYHTNYANLSAYTPAMADVWMQYHHAQYDRVGDEGLLMIEKYLTGAGVDVWETVKYSGTNHGFADPTNSIFDERAADQAHASMYAFFKSRMGPDTCADSMDWHKNGNPAKDCKWVASANTEKRCMVKGAVDKELASSACKMSCGTCDM
mmetsp:Transcript_17666/g.52552  ORF Transcript_17666/g.52552 Transcript_17666/m.52552 type:complete len:360 (-) Transcript_17666:97-1176(-)|eukprot:CAMPEP_0119260468 /NCGR_PEP_ID=MMETSP1329-20130426/837_1 /TAXON_ID=114041 /ORGANISM="Genus nov. species nov., Strain RCC1024" /LENGTH=359 /DNA_ID=CAMNT_0007259891 /DNA_START=40 /DNA_END=1119 /DNA_ORIENTATION=+